jgi:hypothetical protein
MPVNQNNLERLVAHFNEMQFGFVAINTYKNLLGEVSSRRINVGFNYEKAKIADLATLRAGIEFIPSESGQYTRADWDRAISELITGLDTPDENRSNGAKNAYIDLTEKQTGILLFNNNTKQIYIRGVEFEGSKKIVEGTKSKKVVNSASKTIAKNKIRKEYLKTGSIRLFTVFRLGEIKLKGETLEITDYNEGE